jgi:hypothetical protein
MLSGRDVLKHLRPMFDKRADESIVFKLLSQEVIEGSGCLWWQVKHHHAIKSQM